MKKMVIVLTTVTLLSGFILSFFYMQVEDRIQQNAIDALNKSLEIVLPEAKTFEKLENNENMDIYIGKNSNNDDIGYAIIAYANGYQGEIKIVCSLSADLKGIKTIYILEQSETPGLGAKIKNNEFRSQFELLATNKEIICIKGESNKSYNEISAISGATISSKAVTDGLNNYIAKAKKIINNQ